MKTISQVLNDTIPDATRLILNNGGIAVVHQTLLVARYDVVAVIGFSGNGFGGALGFGAERSIIKAAYGESDTVLSDSWLGEVANQLLGRLKNALLLYGVEVRLAITLVLHGLDLKMRAGESQINQFQFASPCGSTCVWVDANWNVHQPMTLADLEQQPQAEKKQKQNKRGPAGPQHVHCKQPEQGHVE